MNCFPVREAWSVQELVFLPTWVSVGIHPWLLSKDHQHHAPKKWDGSDAELVWGRSCPAARERCSGGAVVRAAIQRGKASRIQLGKRPKVSF